MYSNRMLDTINWNKPILIWTHFSSRARKSFSFFLNFHFLFFFIMKKSYGPKKIDWIVVGLFHRFYCNILTQTRTHIEKNSLCVLATSIYPHNMHTINLKEKKWIEGLKCETSDRERPILLTQRDHFSMYWKQTVLAINILWASFSKTVSWNVSSLSHNNGSFTFVHSQKCQAKIQPTQFCGTTIM